MDSINTKLALYGSKNECARTNTVFLYISEVCNGTVSLRNLGNWGFRDLGILGFRDFGILRLRGLGIEGFRD